MTDYKLMTDYKYTKLHELPHSIHHPKDGQLRGRVSACQDLEEGIINVFQVLLLIFFAMFQKNLRNCFSIFPNKAE